MILDESKEFTAWLIRHADHFKTYSIEEIRNVALACGFSPAIIAQWMTQFRLAGNR